MLQQQRRPTYSRLCLRHGREGCPGEHGRAVHALVTRLCQRLRQRRVVPTQRKTVGRGQNGHWWDRSVTGGTGARSVKRSPAELLPAPRSVESGSARLTKTITSNRDTISQLSTPRKPPRDWTVCLRAPATLQCPGRRRPERLIPPRPRGSSARQMAQSRLHGKGVSCAPAGFHETIPVEGVIRGRGR